MIYGVLFFEYLGIYPLWGTTDLLSVLGKILLLVFVIIGFLLFFKHKYLDSDSSGIKRAVINPNALCFLRWLFIISFLTSFLSMILMKRLLVDVSSIRYQIVSITLFFAWLVAEYEFEFQKNSRLFGDYFRLILPMIFVIIAFNVYIPADLSFYKKLPEKKHIAQILEANNIKVAYGTYWNSSVITVFSGGKVNVLPISIKPIVSQLKHLSSDRLWRNRSLFEKSALILTKEEYNYFKTISEDFKKVFPQLKEILTVDDKYYVVIYNQNLAQYIYPVNQLESIEKIDGKFEFENCKDCIINVRGRSSIEVAFTFYNQTNEIVISSAIEHPFNVGVSLLGANGEILETNFASISFYRSVLPGDHIVLKASLNNIPQKLGIYYLRFAIVRAGIKWYLDNEGPVTMLAISIQ